LRVILILYQVFQRGATNCVEANEGHELPLGEIFMPPSQTPETRWLRKWARRAVILGFFALGLILTIVIGTSLYQSKNQRMRLDHAIAQLDRDDPHWRLEDLYKDIPPVLDAENSVVVLRQIVAQKPANWPAADVQAKLENLEPQRQLRPDQAILLEKEMERSPATTQMVRRLVDLPRGYTRIVWTPDVILTTHPMLTETREIAEIARFDILLRIHERDFDGALDSSRAMLNAGRGNAPCFALLQMLVRQGIQGRCLDVVERTLAQGQASETSLRTLQSLLEDEMSQPLLLQGIRGERASAYGAVEFLFKQNPSGMPFKASMNMALESETDPLRKISALVYAPFNSSPEANQAMILQSMTDLIEALNLPEIEQRLAIAKVDALGKDVSQPTIARLLLPAAIKIRGSFLRSQARLRCAVAAIAAERYRQKQGSWPKKLETLAPAELKQVGLDPFTGQPLIMKSLSDGLVIYSVGQNGNDDGGQIAAQNGSPLDIGFRLWDPNQRRQPPAESPDESK
jgi:hypothetical protein